MLCKIFGPVRGRRGRPGNEHPELNRILRQVLPNTDPCDSAAELTGAPATNDVLPQARPSAAANADGLAVSCKRKESGGEAPCRHRLGVCVCPPRRGQADRELPSSTAYTAAHGRAPLALHCMCLKQLAQYECAHYHAEQCTRGTGRPSPVSMHRTAVQGPAAAHEQESATE